MKTMIVHMVIWSMALAASLTVWSQSDIERKIEMIFLYQPQIDMGEKYDVKAKLEKLGHEQEVKAILLKMLTKHKYAEAGTEESLYLNGATWMLGEMQEKQAIDPLSQMLFDRRVHENVRALAARSLGQIDPEATKSVLLKALDPRVADYPFIRIEAAKALAKTSDRRALKAIEQAAAKERDEYFKQQFKEAASELQRRIQRNHAAQPKK